MYVGNEGGAMKRKLAISLMCICFASVLALAACSGSSTSSSSSSASTSSASSSSASGQVGLADPWSNVASAQEAAQGAGVGTFGISADIEYADLGKPFKVTYRYMDGIAEAIVEFPASEVVARKGTASKGDDISGDYNTYAYTWTDDIDGISVTCQGNRQGEAAKATWSDGEYRYSTCTRGLGGDTDFGLNHDRLAAFVKALK